MKISGIISSLSLMSDSAANINGYQHIPQNKYRVVYNNHVSFVSVSSFTRMYNEHSYTDPFFCELASYNDKNKWQTEGVPPVICTNLKSTNELYIIKSYGCTRLNSACKVASQENKDILIPAFIVPESWVDQEEQDPNLPPKIILTELFNPEGWTFHSYMAKPSNENWGDGDFNGFS